MTFQDMPVAEQREIIAEFKENPDAFSKVYDFYYEPILKYLIKRSMSTEIAYDLTADSFLKAFNTFHKFQWKGISIKVWIYRIATNVLRDHYRQKPKDFVLSDTLEGHEALSHDIKEEIEAMDKALFGDEDLVRLRAAIDGLNPRYQNVISLYYFTGMSHIEIAQTIGKSHSAVKTMMHRAMKQLKEQLNKEPQTT